MSERPIDTVPDADALRERVRTDYARVAETAQDDDGACCAPGCCTPGTRDAGEVSRALGYTQEELDAAPDGSNLGLGCGNPQAIASLQPGERVLDLGSGAGFDAFLAARRVGPTGRAIGVDMTPAMLQKARDNQRRSKLDNVEFRLGEIEALPLADESVDVVMSNCVINLSPEKARVFAEVYRVLRPGGRVAVSDVVLTAPLPQAVRGDLANHSACVSGAASIDELQTMLTSAGFVDVQITPSDESRAFIKDWVPGTDVSDYVCSAAITAQKPLPCTPGAGCC